jgi:hypothetical protein
MASRRRTSRAHAGRFSAFRRPLTITIAVRNSFPAYTAEQCEVGGQIASGPRLRPKVAVQSQGQDRERAQDLPVLLLYPGLLKLGPLPPHRRGAVPGRIPSERRRNAPMLSACMRPRVLTGRPFSIAQARTALLLVVPADPPERLVSLARPALLRATAVYLFIASRRAAAWAPLRSISYSEPSREKVIVSWCL